MRTQSQTIHGAGLGLRRALMEEMSGLSRDDIPFLEVAPENWIGIGGSLGRRFRRFSERFPVILHGLSLSLGSPSPLDESFVRQVKAFMDEHNMDIYSEHLSYCSDDGHLYDLMPIPFSEEAVHYVSARIRRVQDILERPLVIENISYYAAPGQQMSEAQFINAVLQEADCELLLDVNNVYVNAFNHGYDAHEFIRQMPTERIRYLHVAGHYVEDEELLIDTHGADICARVWELLDDSYAQHGVQATLLERDFNLPPLAELLGELEQIRLLQQKRSEDHVQRAHG